MTRTKEQNHEYYKKYYAKLKNDPEKYKAFLDKVEENSKKNDPEIERQKYKDKIDKIKSDPIKYKKYLEDNKEKYNKVKNDPKVKERQKGYYKTRLKRLNECKDLLGAKCSICGYDKNYSVLQFHHLDPLLKEFNIGNSGYTDIDIIKEEIKKCVLLCSNCHFELHHPDLSIPPLA